MKLSDICDIGVGHTARGRLEPASVGGIPVLQLRDLSVDGLADPAHLARVNIDDFRDRHMVKTGNVVFRSRGEQNMAFSLDARFHEPVLAMLPLFILRPKLNAILPEYLAWAINQPSAQHHFDSVAQGTNMRMVSRSDVGSLEIDLPDSDTQRKIVVIDELVKREQTLIARIAGKRKELMTLILGDQARQHSLNADPETENG